MANLTNSAKLIEEMSKKAYKTELPTVNNATVTVAVNGNTGTNSFTTNQASNSTLKITVGKSDVGLGNVDNTSDANKPISTATQAALDLKADKSEISSVYKYKGSKANYDALPSSGNVTGDVWNVEAAHTTAPIFPAGSNLAWDGSAWDVLGGTVDLSNYLAKDNTTAFTPTGDYNPATKKYVDDNKTEYNAGEGISIGDALINARKGPSPDGFHVPSIIEWQGLKTIMDGLSLTTGDSWRINLHMPFAGHRHHSDASLRTQGSASYYCSSSPYGSSTPYGTLRLNLDSSGVGVGSYELRASCNSVRCFKDSFVTPTSSWTVVQGTLGGAGIFRNQTEGIISITSDGTTGYTIQDKNLGATTVYNDGDTLTEANMGNMYQWGNNYGFPSTGTISKTSSTQVDASTYGPTNPYSSDIYITGSNDWSSVHNDDLWGDTSGTFTQENVITNTGVLSVNGQTGDVTIASPDLSNYLAKNNTTAFTPTGNYNPATKKYVDDSLPKIKIVQLPRVNDSFSSIRDWLYDGGSVIFYDTYSEMGTVVGNKYYVVVDYDDEGSIKATSTSGTTLDIVTINFTWGTYVVNSITTKSMQDALVSGTNIKTVNGTSILGSGDLPISGLPSGGTTGQVVTKTASGAEWADPAGGGEIVYATQAEYDALPSSKLTDGKNYFIYE